MGAVQKRRARAALGGRGRAGRLAPETAGGIEIRHLQGIDELAGCLALEEATWGGADRDLVPLPVFVVAAETGGQVLGAFDTATREMAGFTLAMPGVHGRTPYLHSHMTAVLDRYQNRGIGRRLKLYQRRDALARGIRLVEWTFDPLELRNAYFNLVRLGAVVRRLIPDCYGRTSSPLHAGLPTDRLMAEWWLNSRRVKRAIEAEARHAVPVSKKKQQRVFVPGNIAELKAVNPAEAARIQTRVRQEFQRWFARNYAATGVERTEEGTYYLLEPYASSLTQPA